MKSKGFKIILKPNKKYKAVGLHLLNKDKYGFASKYKIYDAGTKQPYLFLCPICKKQHVNIDYLNTCNISSISIAVEPLIAYGGYGVASKILQCLNCETEYLIGIGYEEPNNGRDVWFIHSIFELEEDKD